jgi:hypothetical protein
MKPNQSDPPFIAWLFVFICFFLLLIPQTGEINHDNDNCRTLTTTDSTERMEFSQD